MALNVLRVCKDSLTDFLIAENMPKEGQSVVTLAGSFIPGGVALAAWNGTNERTNERTKGGGWGKERIEVQSGVKKKRSSRSGISLLLFIRKRGREAGAKWLAGWECWWVSARKNDS